MDGFPDPGSTAEATASGLMHLALGAVGFLAIAAAAFVVAGGLSHQGDTGAGIRSHVAGAVVLVGVLGGAALSPGTDGVVLLWIAVMAGWAWLAITSIAMYRMVPHPDTNQRTAAV